MRQASSIGSNGGILGRAEVGRGEKELIRLTGGRSVLRLVAPKQSRI